MKKSMLSALLALALAVCSGCAAEEAVGKTIVTSFYPMYVFTQNVVRDVPGVRVVNMASESAGCLHDYQLQTRDMVTLEGADALVINGGGMEQFMDKVIAQRPELPVINASDGIEMLCSEDGHDHDGHDHDHGVYNAHVWLDPALAIRQVQNIADGLAAADSENGLAYFGAMILLLGALLTAIYMLGVVCRAWFPGQGTEDEKLAGEKEVSWRMTVPMVILAAGILLTGIFAQPIVNAALAIAGEMG